MEPTVLADFFLLFLAPLKVPEVIAKVNSAQFPSQQQQQQRM